MIMIAHASCNDIENNGFCYSSWRK